MPLIVPYNKLSHEALRGLIEEFVTRPGTDTGYTKGSLDDNVDMVMKQLKLGDVSVVFDEKTNAANILPKALVKDLMDDE